MGLSVHFPGLASQGFSGLEMTIPPSLAPLAFMAFTAFARDPSTARKATVKRTAAQPMASKSSEILGDWISASSGFDTRSLSGAVVSLARWSDYRRPASG